VVTCERLLAVVAPVMCNQEPAAQHHATVLAVYEQQEVLMGYPGRDPGTVTRMDTAHWGCGLNDVGEVCPDHSGTPRTVASRADERRHDEATIAELAKPHRIYMPFWPFWEL
jgi:hypothetical protein